MLTELASCRALDFGCTRARCGRRTSAITSGIDFMA